MKMEEVLNWGYFLSKVPWNWGKTDPVIFRIESSQDQVIRRRKVGRAAKTCNHQNLFRVKMERPNFGNLKKLEASIKKN